MNCNFMPYNNTAPHKPMLPKGIGAVFDIEGKARIQYNLVKMAYYHEQPLFKSQWSYRKCQIWLHAGFRGKDPNEIRENARADLLAIADRLGDKFGCKLTAVRWMRDEWVDFNLTRSARIADAAGLKKGARMEVAGAIHKFSDWSDPDKLQFNPTPKGNPEIPLAHAQIHHKIYSGEYEHRFELLANAIERQSDLQDKFAKNLELHLSVLQEIRDAIKELKEAKK